MVHRRTQLQTGAGTSIAFGRVEAVRSSRLGIDGHGEGLRSRSRIIIRPHRLRLCQPIFQIFQRLRCWSSQQVRWAFYPYLVGRAMRCILVERKFQYADVHLPERNVITAILLRRITKFADASLLFSSPPVVNDILYHAISLLTVRQEQFRIFQEASTRQRRQCPHNEHSYSSPVSWLPESSSCRCPLQFFSLS